MRAFVQVVIAAAMIAAQPAQSSTPAAAIPQSQWAAEPTYRFAGHYEGEWVAEVWLEGGEAPGPPASLFEQRAGEVSGTVALDVACDGTVAAETHAQTRRPASVVSLADGVHGPRVLSATLEVSLDGTLDGALAARSASGVAAADAPLQGTLRDLPTDLETVAEPQAIERSYKGAGTSGWSLAQGQPGSIAGTLEASLGLVSADGPPAPPVELRVSGRWNATRTAMALCPWRATVMVRGSVGNEQLHDEQVELSFRPTGDGRLAGEGRGQALIRGGTPGGCEYSGGGPFSVQVVGEMRAGLFRLRLEDYEQSQLLVTTSCAGGRFVASQPALSTLFGYIELLEDSGSRGHLDLTSAQTDARGTFDITIEPATGAVYP